MNAQIWYNQIGEDRIRPINSATWNMMSNGCATEENITSTGASSVDRRVIGSVRMVKAGWYTMNPTMVPRSMAIPALKNRLRNSRRCSRRDIFPSGDFERFVRFFLSDVVFWSGEVMDSVANYLEDCSFESELAVVSL